MRGRAQGGLYSPNKASAAPAFDMHRTAHQFGPGQADTIAASAGITAPLSPDSRLFSSRREAHPRSTDEILAE